MKKRWPTALEVTFSPDRVVDPRCPSDCCFRTTCPEYQQRYAVEYVFAQGQAPRDCPRFARMEQLLYQTTGARAPETVEAFLELLHEKRGMQEFDEAQEAELAALRDTADQAAYQRRMHDAWEGMRQRFAERNRRRREVATGQAELTLDRSEATP